MYSYSQQKQQPSVRHLLTARMETDIRLNSCGDVKDSGVDETERCCQRAIESAVCWQFVTDLASWLCYKLTECWSRWYVLCSDAAIHCKSAVVNAKLESPTSNLNVSQCICSWKHGHLEQVSELHKHAQKTYTNYYSTISEEKRRMIVSSHFSTLISCNSVIFDLAYEKKGANCMCYVVEMCRH